jgi:rSAM/selenodomain-associated transferase 2
MKLSIIVPMLNEAQQLPALFAHLLSFGRTDSEIIFVDGGSHDGSEALVEAEGLVLVKASRGRANQMNAGAACATGDILLFLHADTTLPQLAHYYITRALSDGAHCWGRFDVHIGGQSPALCVVAWMMNVRSRLTGIATGDQAIFVRRDAFDRVQGFPSQPLMEDIELSKRLKRLSRPACIADRVMTSGRRWEKYGVWRTILLMWRLRWEYWLGADPVHLERLYR